MFIMLAFVFLFDEVQIERENKIKIFVLLRVIVGFSVQLCGLLTSKKEHEPKKNIY